MFSAYQLPFDSALVEGNSGTISFEAARFLAIYDIPVTFHRWDGLVLSTLLPCGPVAGQLNLPQFVSHNDREKRTQDARAILELRLSKSGELVRFISRFYPCNPKLAESEVRRGRTEEPVLGLMGWERRTAVAYWAEFSKVANHPWPEGRFVSRKGKGRSWVQSATVPVNALLSCSLPCSKGAIGTPSVRSASNLRSVGCISRRPRSSRSSTIFKSRFDGWQTCQSLRPSRAVNSTERRTSSRRRTIHGLSVKARSSGDRRARPSPGAS